MPELSILEILKYALKSLMDSKVFILILLEIAIFAVSVIFYKLMDKKVVKYTAVGSSLVILMFYIVNYIIQRTFLFFYSILCVLCCVLCCYRLCL